MNKRLLTSACMYVLFFCIVLLTYNTSVMQRLDEAASDVLVGQHIIGLFHYLGETVFVVALGVVIVGYLLWRKKRSEALFAFLMVFGGYGINQAVKHIVERPRPNIVDQLTSYSFPSGHTMASLLWIATVLFLLTHGKKTTKRIIAMWVIGIVIAMLVGLSRVVESRHYFTDVLAGWMLAAAWLYVCLYVIKVQLEKKKKR